MQSIELGSKGKQQGIQLSTCPNEPNSAGDVSKRTQGETKQCRAAGTAWHSTLQQSFSTSALMTVWAGQFFVVGAMLCIVGCSLAASLASTQ